VFRRWVLSFAATEACGEAAPATPRLWPSESKRPTSGRGTACKATGALSTWPALASGFVAPAAHRFNLGCSPRASGAARVMATPSFMH